MSNKQAPRNGRAGLQGVDLTGGAVDPGNNANELARQRLELFSARCHELAQRVNLGTISFIDAVDMAYSAAVRSGMADDLGDDAVQATMAAAFMGARR
jgi:hypothetical protein